MPYKTYSCAVIKRKDFSPVEHSLLKEFNLFWNALVDEHNRLLEQLTEMARPEGDALALLEESRTLSPKMKGQLKPLLQPWQEMLKRESVEVDRLTSEYKRRCKQVSKQSSVWWPNRERIWNQFIAAHRTQMKLGRLLKHRQTSDRLKSGFFAFRFQKSVTFVDLLEGKDPNVRLECLSKDKYRIFLTIDKAKGIKESAEVTELEFIASRVPEENEIIHNITFSAHRDKDNVWRGKVAFLTLNEDIEPTRNDLVVGLDFGWRMGSEGLLVLTAVFGNGVCRRLILPDAWVGKWQYAENLFKHLNAGVPEGASWENYEDKAPEDWLSRTAKMRKEYRNTLRRLQRSRNDYYHQFVKEMTEIAGAVVVEKMNFGQLELKQNIEVKIQQKMAAPRILEDMIRYSCKSKGIPFLVVASRNKTQIHHACGHLNKSSRSTQITCQFCGATYDPDVNAAENIRNEGLKNLQINQKK